MKLIILLSVVALAAAAPADVQLLRSEFNNDGLGNYYTSFEQSDGTKQERRGLLKDEGREGKFLAVAGSYEWVGPDGVRYVVRYTADDNGYRTVVEQIQPRPPGQPRGSEQPVQPRYPGIGLTPIRGYDYSKPALVFASLVAG
ncbi:endocuticle structural protein SgAbd-6-like isoform X1 [Ostrinia furnacalis]|uniref:endocuticle structural protein SgAbd-6-like isoform X1 n=1 Tax=Ostrinia furnacalis TaxID=93504 RepID=UPI001040A930|nr:endocuticle structural protein SgAbd-6-like isoform X1 [Ostrinia furnacalis]